MTLLLQNSINGTITGLLSQVEMTANNSAIRRPHGHARKSGVVFDLTSFLQTAAASPRRPEQVSSKSPTLRIPISLPLRQGKSSYPVYPILANDYDRPRCWRRWSGAGAPYHGTSPSGTSNSARRNSHPRSSPTTAEYVAQTISSGPRPWASRTRWVFLASSGSPQARATSP